MISKGRTNSDGIVAGVFELDPGNTLLRHSHAEPEVYYILEGEGVLEIDDETHTATSETAVFIPGDAVHSIRNSGKGALKVFYTFPANSFEEIEYKF